MPTAVVEVHYSTDVPLLPVILLALWPLSLGTLWPHRYFVSPRRRLKLPLTFREVNVAR